MHICPTPLPDVIKLLQGKCKDKKSHNFPMIKSQESLYVASLDYK